MVISVVVPYTSSFNKCHLPLNTFRASPLGFCKSRCLSLSVLNSRLSSSYRLPTVMAVQEISGSPTKDSPKMNIPHVLTVAGSDSGAGAGIQADLKTCAARGVYCSTVVTALTAQNTVGVQAVNMTPEDFVAEQLKSVLSDMQVDVVKTGMLPSAGTVKVLCQSLAEFPVREKSSFPWQKPPNLKEASALLGCPQLNAVDDMRSAAKLLYNMGPRNVLVKGGDLPESLDAVDIFFDGKNFLELCSPRIKTRNTHGTGCSLASCIAAELAKGSSMLSAVKTQAVGEVLRMKERAQTRKMDLLTRENENLKKESTSLNDKVGQLTVRVEEQDQRIGVLEGEVNRLEAKVGEDQVKTSSLEAELAAARAKVAELEKLMKDEAEAAERIRKKKEQELLDQVKRAREKLAETETQAQLDVALACEQSEAANESLGEAQEELVEAEFALKENEYIMDYWRPKIYQSGYSLCREQILAGASAESLAPEIEVPPGWWGDLRPCSADKPFEDFPPRLRRFDPEPESNVEEELEEGHQEDPAPLA